MNYIYILSNKALKENLLKIGFTSKHPDERAKELSKSTSIPLNFRVEYFKEISDKRVIETRVHLLLSDYRVNHSKEFFNINKGYAKRAIELAVNYTNNHEGESDTISTSQRLNCFIGSSPSLSGNALGILFILMASTPYNTILELALNDYEIIDCFMSAINYSNITKKSIKNSSIALQNFCKKYHNLCIKVEGLENEIQVFNYLKYAKGQCAWSFSPDFRPFFTNEKITHLL